jgi:hypothetical protein
MSPAGLSKSSTTRVTPPSTLRRPRKDCHYLVRPCYSRFDICQRLSTLGILNIARTPIGRTLMRQWFLRPSLDLDIISARQDAVDCFVRPENGMYPTLLTDSSVVTDATRCRSHRPDAAEPAHQVDVAPRERTRRIERMARSLESTSNSSPPYRIR